jgi:hypothetical protein
MKILFANNFIHTLMCTGTVKFGMSITELIKESSHFSKSVIVIVLGWSVHTVTTMKKS